MAEPVRLAKPADIPEITAFLHAHLPVSFYPLANLTEYGMGGDHPRSMRFWLWGDSDQLVDVLGVTARGFLYPVFTTDVVTSAVKALAGMQTLGFGGAPDQVMRLRAASALRATPALDFIEPVYRLPLDQLVQPDVTGVALRPLSTVKVELLAQWRATFMMETQGIDAKIAAQRALYDLEEIVKNDTYRVLMDRDQPVAMTGFNAVFADVVQVGGVFVPPQLRGRGYGRIAVALHLQQAYASGVGCAYLSAATATAARAYEALGFARHGRYAAVVYDKGQVIHG